MNYKYEMSTVFHLPILHFISLISSILNIAVLQKRGRKKNDFYSVVYLDR